MRYFGNSNLKLRYCGILQTCRIPCFGRFKNYPPGFYDPFLVSCCPCRFENASKQLKDPLIYHASLYYMKRDNTLAVLQPINSHGTDAPAFTTNLSPAYKHL